MNALRKLEQLGQSIWYDNISRAILRRGELQRMVDEGLLGRDLQSDDLRQGDLGQRGL